MWHRRLWEQVICDEKDGTQYGESLHDHPVQHGLACAPKDGEFSRVQRDVREGVYAIHWGETEESNVVAGIGHT